MALKDDIANLPVTVGEGSAGHLGNHQVIHAGLKDHEYRLGDLEDRGKITWVYEGTGTPNPTDIPGARVGDRIVREFDGTKWRIDE